MGGGAIRAAAKAAAYRSPAFFAGPAIHRNPWNGHKSSAAAPSAAAAEVGISAVAAEKSWPEAAGFEDWELAGWSDEELEAPRVLFGPVPTFDEAKAATADLKIAMERTNIAQAASNPVPVGFQSILTEASSIVPKMPKHVVEAFSFLQGSPEAQDVVASLASDKNVWDAVMRNEKVMEFYNSHKSVISPLETEDAAESHGSNVITESCVESTAICVLDDFVQSFKLKVEEVVNNISSFFQELMGSSSGSLDIKTLMRSESADIPVGVGATFFVLAIATILVVMFKRE